MFKGKVVAVVAVALALGGCAGTFPLGNVKPQVGRTADQQQLDTLTCKDQAQQAANTNGRVAASFVAGLTIVGAPIAIAADHAKQRDVFSQCMAAKGYTVTPPA